jgi:hypothetical protein
VSRILVSIQSVQSLVADKIYLPSSIAAHHFLDTCLLYRREEEFLEKHKHVSLLEQHKELQERTESLLQHP